MYSYMYICIYLYVFIHIHMYERKIVDFKLEYESG